MIRLLGQLMRLPIAFLGLFFEGLGHTARSMERIAEETFDKAVRDTLQPLIPGQREETVPAAAPPRLEPAPVEIDSGPDKLGVEEQPTRHQSEERKKMADTNLSDDLIKLVEYAIVSIERRNEKILEDKTLYLEKGNVTGDGFSNARIAKWVENNAAKAKDLDLDALRVYYSVLSRWPKKDLRYEEKRLDMEEAKIELLKKKTTP